MGSTTKLHWKKVCLVGLAALPITIGGCNSSTFVTMSGGSSTSISVSNDRTNVKIVRPEYELGFECKGKWTFSADESDLEAGEPNSKAELIEIDRGLRQSYRVECDGNGELTRSYWREGKLVEMDDHARNWVKAAFSKLFRESSFQAKERAERMLTDGQQEKLFQTIDSIQDQFTKNVYMQAIVSYPELNEELFQKTVDLSKNLKSEFDRAEFLTKAAKRLPESKDYQSTWLEGLDGFQSDFELAKAIRNAMNEKGLEPTFLKALVLQASEQIKSDFELRGVLEHFVGQVERADLASDVAKATTAIESDFERKNAISALLRVRRLSEESLGIILDSIESMQSDFERSASLRELLASQNKTAGIQDRVREIANKMGDFEKNNVLNQMK